MSAPSVGPEPAVVARLSGVSVRYPRREAPALVADRFEVRRGERVLVVGPSGSGKSTLLHVLSGAVPHAYGAHLAGEVEVGGLGAEAGIAARSRHVGVVAQDPASGVCLPTVEEEVALPLQSHGADPEEIGERVDTALADVGATHLRHRRTHELSGGEAQRVALAAATAVRPGLLLLDEPTSMLDAAGVRAVAAALETPAVPGADRPASVLVEHRLDELGGARAGAVPGRVVVLDGHGVLLDDGPTREVLTRHAPRLRADGCWLPLEQEVLALTGHAGAPGRRALRGLASGGRAARCAPGRDLLTARDLVVGRSRGRGRRRTATTTVSGVDLTVREGEVVALLGGNGSGKSTLLLTLAGLLAPLAGTTAGDRPGMVFQNPEHQFLASTVAEEVGHGLPPGLRADVVSRTLERFGLSGLADRDPYRLSGGQKRRVGLAAMLAHDRALLLLDEPTWGLDRRGTADVARAVREHQERGGGVVLASHDLRLVAGVADRVVLLAGGAVLADRPADQVLGDRSLLLRAGLDLPPLLAGVLGEVPPADLRACLEALDGPTLAGSRS